MNIEEEIRAQLRDKNISQEKYYDVLNIVVRNCETTQEILDSIEEAIDHEMI